MNLKVFKSIKPFKDIWLNRSMEHETTRIYLHIMLCKFIQMWKKVHKIPRRCVVAQNFASDVSSSAGFNIK